MTDDQKKKNADRNRQMKHLLHRIPPAVYLATGGALSLYGVITAKLQHNNATGVGLLILAMLFVGVGIYVIVDDIRCEAFLRSWTVEKLMLCHHQDIERVVSLYYQAQGYLVRPLLLENLQYEDADLLAVRSKERVILQYNHWNEPVIGEAEVLAFVRAHRRYESGQAVIVTSAKVSPEGQERARLKGVTFLTLETLISRIRTLEEPDSGPAQPLGPQVSNEPSAPANKFLFVSGEAVDGQLDRLGTFLVENPEYLVVFTSKKESILSDAQVKLPELHPRLLGVTPNLDESGGGTSTLSDPMAAWKPLRHRTYFEIMAFLKWLKEGTSACWIAIDTSPRGFPEGCTELVVVDPRTGLDHAAIGLLHLAMDTKANATSRIMGSQNRW